MKKNQKVALGIAAILAIIFICTPLPLRITDADREYAISHALDALLTGKRVLNSRGLTRLNDWETMKTKKLSFANETNVPERIFLSRGLQPKIKGRKLDSEAGEALIDFSH